MSRASRTLGAVRDVRAFCEHAAWAAPHVLVVSDLDGTLTSITPRPESARLAQATLRTLSALATRPRCALAIVTGRAVPDAWSRVEQARPAWLVAEHGAFIRDATGAFLHTDVIPFERTSHLRARAYEIAGVFSGAIVEEKASGVALHHREVAPQKREALISMFRLACAVQRAAVLEGRLVIEGRLASSDPASALHEVLARVPADTWILAAGDDLFDRPLLQAVARRRHADTVFVASDEVPEPVTPVDTVVHSPEEWLSLLAELSTMLDSRS